MTRANSLKNALVTTFASAFLGAAAALLVVTCCTTPIRDTLQITHVYADGNNGRFNLGLGTLGGCSDFLLAGRGGETSVDCKSTSAGYVARLLLPADLTDLNVTDPTPASEYPYTYNPDYEVVTTGMTRPLVMIPIATAFAILAALMFIAASYKMGTWLDLATAVFAGLAMILAWAGFGVAYKLTDRVRAMLKGYNAGFRSDGFQLITERGSATWILLAGALLLTLALPLILYRWRIIKQSPASTHVARKGSRDGEDVEMA